MVAQVPGSGTAGGGLIGCSGGLPGKVGGEPPAGGLDEEPGPGKTIAPSDGGGRLSSATGKGCGRSTIASGSGGASTSWAIGVTVICDGARTVGAWGLGPARSLASARACLVSWASVRAPGDRRPRRSARLCALAAAASTKELPVAAPTVQKPAPTSAIDKRLNNTSDRRRRARCSARPRRQRSITLAKSRFESPLCIAAAAGRGRAPSFKVKDVGAPVWVSGSGRACYGRPRNGLPPHNSSMNFAVRPSTAGAAMSIRRTCEAGPSRSAPFSLP